MVESADSAHSDLNERKTGAVVGAIALLLFVAYQREFSVVSMLSSGASSWDSAASIPAWLGPSGVAGGGSGRSGTGVARFQRVNADQWTSPTGPVLLSLSRSQQGEDVHAYNTYFYGKAGGTFLEMVCAKRLY